MQSIILSKSSFGVKNLTELPSINTVQVEEFKEEAEAEVDDRLGI